MLGKCSDRYGLAGGGSTPLQGTCLGCRLGTWSGFLREATMFLSLSFLLPSPFSNNKINKIFF